FISGRRRHTRSYGDWSSDVCSSDLICTMIAAVAAEGESAARETQRILGYLHATGASPAEIEFARDHIHNPPSVEELARRVGSRRSEERRVGKAWRSWLAAASRNA